METFALCVCVRFFVCLFVNKRKEERLKNNEKKRKKGNIIMLFEMTQKVLSSCCDCG